MSSCKERNTPENDLQEIKGDAELIVMIKLWMH